MADRDIIEGLIAEAKGGNPYAFGAMPTTARVQDYLYEPGATPMAPPATMLLPGTRKVPVFSQQGGTCVGNSIAGAMMHLEYVDSGKVVPFNGEILNLRVNRDQGGAAMPSDILDTILKDGVPSVNVDGMYFLQGYAAVDFHTPDAIKAAMASGQVLVIAIWLQNGFGDHPNDYLAFDQSATTWGYHEVCIVGYDAQGITIQNSWDTWWGNGGFANLAWDYVANRTGMLYAITDKPDVAGGYTKGYVAPDGATERAVRRGTDPAVFLVKGDGRIWITSPTEAKRYGVDLRKVQSLPPTDKVWALPLIGPVPPGW